MLAAAAANKAAKALPPSLGTLLGGDGGTAVGEAVIVNGASLIDFYRLAACCAGRKTLVGSSRECLY